MLEQGAGASFVYTPRGRIGFALSWSWEMEVQIYETSLELAETEANVCGTMYE